MPISHSSRSLLGAATLLALATLLPPCTGNAQIQINEVCATNVRSFPDITDFEDYPDWIELKNTTGNPLSLDGWFLSNKPTNPFKWAFPAGAVIPAHGFLVVVADGRDAAPGQSYPRGYWPWRNFLTERFHTNFKLSSAGDSLLLTHADINSNIAFVNASTAGPGNAAVWKYLDNGSDQGTAWHDAAFDDSSWNAGPARLGYGDPVDTTLSFGPDSGNKYITTYFRHKFQVSDPAAVQQLTLQLLVDDGAVIYLNGVEAARRNMPDGVPASSTLASAVVGGADETTFFPLTIEASLLRQGENILAVEVHQGAAASSDVSFDLALTGTTLATTSSEEVSFTLQLPDISYGRDPAAPTLWKQFAEPTPGAENAGAIVTDLRLQGIPVSASIAGGTYASARTVSLSSSVGQIRYTLDGSTPRSSSALYSAPLTLSSTTVLRARCFVPGRVPGPILTRTYLIGETQGSLPIVSVVADPETLFGDTIGIYRNQHEPLPDDTRYGLRDVYKGKDAPGHVEFFAPAGAPGFLADCGVRIGGENNWIHPQKALNLALDSKYGATDLPYVLFPAQSATLYSSFTLRDGGDNWEREMLRDCLIPRLAHGYLRADTADYRPSIVFVNGSYYGLHDIRERWDDTWFAQNHHLPPGSVDHLLYGHVTSADVTLGVQKGSDKEWRDLIQFLASADLTQPKDWARVEASIDLESFMDFVITESYANNSSWLHNREFWRERKSGAQWRWFLTDLDRTFSTGNTSGVLAQMIANEDILSRLNVSTSFRQRLAQRYAIHMASTFSTQRVQSIISSMDAEIPASEISRHAARWSTGSASTSGMSAATRAAGIAEIKAYASARAANVHEELSAELGVNAPVQCTLNVSGQGTVLLEGIPVPPSTLRLFPNIAFQLKAVPAPGYIFSKWNGLSGSPTTPSTTASLQSNLTITAQFVPSTETLLGGTLSANTVLTTKASPYTLSDDLLIPQGITLTIPAGVTLQIPQGRHIRVQGALLVQGDQAHPVQFLGRNGERWGAVSFENPNAPSVLRHLIIRGASSGWNPLLYPSALSGLNADLLLESVDIQLSGGPVFCRGGQLTVRDSTFHTPYSGDCINVKQGRGTVERSTFYGNHAPDTDAIDFDGVVDGRIRNNRIYNFRGLNSDGVDLGESCVNILVEGNCIYFSSDKGVSIGQGSSAILRNNLVVGCAVGVGIKDSGSTALIDQNTFVDCQIGVDIYEKNFAMGGGSAVLTNDIFSGCSTVPVQADSLSTLTASYCVSDTTPIPGIGNRRAPLQFIDPAALNFQLRPTSPAINAGDPAHSTDPNGSRADIGASYQFQPTDYPFPPKDGIVINEVLAHTAAGTGWIELHNRSSKSVDLSGWCLSDDPDDAAKYQIAPKTILPPKGFLLLSEATQFGLRSKDPGRTTGFALDPKGQSLHLRSSANDEVISYQTKVSFGPSQKDQSFGMYYKAAEDDFDFVLQQKPSPKAANQAPLTGPLVISEIMTASTDPDRGDQFIELLNTSTANLTLYDSTVGKAWRIKGGIHFKFPSDPPLSLAPGERIVLTKNLAAFHTRFDSILATSTRVFQWDSGSLDPGGEAVEIARPDPTSPLPQNNNPEKAAAFLAGPIKSLKIVASADAIERLRQDPRTYVEVSIQEQGGATYNHVALKLKGSVGSFRPIDDKPGFSLNTDKFPGGDRFHGLDRFQLNNCAQDGTALNEKLCGEIARMAGVPASRCTHAIVSLNDRFLGIYVFKEGFSEDFLAPFFSRTDGNLYDGGFCSEINAGSELDRGNPAIHAGLDSLVAAVNEGDPALQLQKVEAIVDVDAYLRYLALENILCHWDGYSFNRNNYRFYQNPATGRFQFFLHGMDQTFGDPGATVFNAPGATVGTSLWSKPQNQTRYQTILKDVCQKVLKPIDWAARTEQVGQKLANALAAIDPQLAADYRPVIGDARERIRSRISSVLNQAGVTPAQSPVLPKAEPTVASSDDTSEVQFTTVDRVHFDNHSPWPQTSAALSLTRVTNPSYGNTFSNWAAAPASPGMQMPISLTVTSLAPTMGSIPAALNGTSLYPPGRLLQIKATAKPGFIFAGWTGDITSSLNPLPLTLLSPTSISAHFIPLPFTAASFQGTLSGQGVAGTWKVTLSASGAFSGQFLLNSKAISFRGFLDATGHAQLSLPNGSVLLLQQDFATGSISGSLSSISLSATFSGDPLPKFSAASKCPLAGTHTLLLPAESPTPSPKPPAGSGFASLTISTTGSGRLSGILPDGTPFLFSAPLNASDSLPIAVVLSRRAGNLTGALSFTRGSDGAPDILSGPILWERPTSTSPSLPWPAGFSTTLQSIGSRWTPPPKGSRILPSLDSSNGAASLSLSSTDSAPSTASLLIDSSHHAVENPASDLQTTLNLSPATGLFTGSFHPPGLPASKRLSFRGAILRAQQRVEGFFLPTPQISEKVSLQAVTNNP